MSPALPREERDAIRARVEAATPGPWVIVGGWSLGTTVVAHRQRDLIVSDDGAVPCLAVEADAAFIAHARTDVPALLDALDAAEEENERLREAVLIEAADALVKFADDTYPRDIFVPPSRTDYDEINALLRRERGHMLDAIAADCYRRALAVGAGELRALAADEGDVRARERASFAALLDAEDDEDERTGR